MTNFPRERDRLQPPEALFNALPFSLTDGIASMLRCASINRAPPDRSRFRATCGVTFKFRHSTTKSAVSYALSPPTIACFVPGSVPTSPTVHLVRPFRWPQTPRCSRCDRCGLPSRCQNRSAEPGVGTFPPKALQTRPGFQQRSIHSKVLIR